MKCIICGEEAEYILCGCSFCEKHFYEANKFLLGLQPSTPSAEFDAVVKDLMEHKWKGKRKAGGGYSEGSLSWGWDYREQFKPETIKALESGPITIDEYEFSLTDRIVQTRKVKQK
ncbi:MAG: hypothetical protein J7K62_02380 [Thermoplasmata archaeon]|nr:hypothetical protein [Thermoplasmata archaeon]